MTWEYLAGFFDGEGHIARLMFTRGLRKSRMAPEIGISQSRERGRILLEEIVGFLERNGVHGAYVHKQKGPSHWAPGFDLRIQRRESVIAFLLAIQPYLRVKKLEAQDTLRFMKIYPSLRGHLNAMLTWESIRANKKAA